MHPRDEPLRAQWLALCADPTRDDLAGSLAATFERELDAALSRLTAATTDDARADAIGGTLRAVLGLQLTRERRPFTPGPYALELRRRLRDEPEPGDDAPGDALDDVAPQPDDADPYLPWILGDRAREAPEPERGPLLDRAIAAFDAIALRPIDPGNDLGPFTRIADLLDEARVRRALAVTERMAGADWGLELSCARAYLYIRLAELGHVVEAEALLPRIVDRSVRAFARGGALGHRIRHALPWSVPPASEFAADDQLQFTAGLARALPEPPEALALACMALVSVQEDPRIRDATVSELVGHWSAVAPLSVWFSLLCDHASGTARLTGLLELAAARLADPLAPELVREALAQIAGAPDPDPGGWIDELVAVRPLVPRTDAVALFAQWMTHAAGSPRAWLLRDLHYCRAFEELLRWLAGDAALAAAARALDELTALLADVPPDMPPAT